jgi:putative ABC transport system permease protein
MMLLDRLRALSVLGSHPGRTALTLLGIIVGSGAIVLVAGIVSGTELALVRTAQSATGSDLITVRRRELPPAERARARPELSRADADALQRSWFAGEHRVHAEAYRQTRASSGGRSKKLRVVSGGPDVVPLFRLELAHGRFLDASDAEQRRRVCVVGHEIWTELLARAPLESEPRIVADGVLWSVVGVLRRKPLIGSTDGTQIWDRKLIVPQTSFDALYNPKHRADRVLMQARTPGARPALPLEAVRASVSRTLRRRHAGADSFELDDAAASAQERMILSIVELLLLAIGALALMVGGINVTNVMLVAVSERRREIGLRRALGATRGSVLWQFMLESGVLALGGGIAGCALGSALVAASRLVLAETFGDFPARVEPWALGLGLTLSLVTGIVAGVAPAARAAALDPTLALRGE